MALFKRSLIVHHKVSLMHRLRESLQLFVCIALRVIVYEVLQRGESRHDCNGVSLRPLVAKSLPSFHGDNIGLAILEARSALFSSCKRDHIGNEHRYLCSLLGHSFVEVEKLVLVRLAWYLEQGHAKRLLRWHYRNFVLL